MQIDDISVISIDQTAEVFEQTLDSADLLNTTPFSLTDPDEIISDLERIESLLRNSN
jgi:hypothetical protein